MQISPNRLNERLNAHGLEAVYFFHGEEPLQLAECADAVRRRAAEDGIDERIVFNADTGIDWQALLGESNAMSLFATRRLVEIRLGSRKPDKDGIDVLEQLTSAAQSDDVLLISAAKFDARARNAKWFKTLEQHSVCVMTRDLKQNALPAWLNQRARRLGKQLTATAAELIADRVEGNMLAAAQEVEKLCLLVEGREIGESEVISAVSDSARYDVFQLADAVLAGELPRAIRIVRGLREEGTEAVLVNWALGRELRQLAAMGAARSRGKQIDAVMDQFRVWKTRRKFIARALDRFNLDELSALLAYANHTDTVIKGARDGNPWDALELLIINAGGTMKFKGMIPDSVALRSGYKAKRSLDRA
jgi:DNA polymerase III subunit delta